VVANAPKKFLIAGLGDALSTYYEARACLRTDAPSLENGGLTVAGMALARACYDTILQYGKQALEACDLNVVTPALEKAVEAAVYLSGVGADNGGLAAAHSIYNGFTTLDEIKTNHGYTVAFGTLVQLLLEGAPEEEIYEVMDFCYEVGLPLTLDEIGITDHDRLMIGCEKATIEGETIHNMVGKITAEDLFAAVLVADKLGKEYYEMRR
ncbi:glycerol dehydrogenase, partial [Rhodovulum adriaticum]|nr:glycerol dehydrogenase [Rhodovulum adriaticum]